MRRLFLLLFLVAAGAFSASRPATAQDHELTIAFNTKPPFFYVDADGPRGLVIEVVSRALDLAGLRYHYEEMPFQRLLHNLKIRRPDFIVLGLSKTTEREEIAVFSKPVFKDQTPVVLFRKQDHDKFAAFNSLGELIASGLLYGRKQGTVQTADALLKNLGDREVVFDSEVAKFPLLLIKHRFDFTIMYPEEVIYAVQDSGVEKSEVETVRFPDMPEGDFRYLLFSKTLGMDIVARINAVIPDFEPIK